ncbi:MAG: hypothetical protein EXX96DRAFT_476503, partial [Benjaminiella poitrasii]
AKKLLYSRFEGLSISNSTERSHMANHSKLSLKNITSYNLERDSDGTIKLRYDFIIAWKITGVDYVTNSVIED